MGKGLIPADLDTWKQRRRGLQTVFIIFISFSRFFLLGSASHPLFNLEVFFSTHCNGFGGRKYKNVL